MSNKRQQYRKDYNEANKERLKAYREANKEHIKAYQKAYREAKKNKKISTEFELPQIHKIICPNPDCRDHKEPYESINPPEHSINCMWCGTEYVPVIHKASNPEFVRRLSHLTGGH